MYNGVCFDELKLSVNDIIFVNACVRNGETMCQSQKVTLGALIQPWWLGGRALAS